MKSKSIFQKIKAPIKVAVLGCAVNGPGEAREADIGIAGARGEGLLFRNGEIVRKVPEAIMVEELKKEIDKIAAEYFANKKQKNNKFNNKSASTLLTPDKAFLRTLALRKVNQALRDKHKSILEGEGAGAGAGNQSKFKKIILSYFSNKKEFEHLPELLFYLNDYHSDTAFMLKRTGE